VKRQFRPFPQETSIVARFERGTKRLCAHCGAKFYDLNKTPIICPKCETAFQIAPAMLARGRGEAAGRPLAKGLETAEVPEIQEAEFVSLEEADVERQATGKVPVVDLIEGEEEIELDETIDDAALIEQQEEGDEDVTGIIGDKPEDEEET